MVLVGPPIISGLHGGHNLPLINNYQRTAINERRSIDKHSLRLSPKPEHELTILALGHKARAAVK
jgi:hypothetical protein